VAFDASSLISYVTRYTEESFSALISFIFIYQAFKVGTFHINAYEHCSCCATLSCLNLLFRDRMKKQVQRWTARHSLNSSLLVLLVFSHLRNWFGFYGVSKLIVVSYSEKALCFFSRPGTYVATAGVSRCFLSQDKSAHQTFLFASIS